MFTEAEINLIKELGKSPVTIPLNEAAKFGELWESVISKVDALADKPERADGE